MRATATSPATSPASGPDAGEAGPPARSRVRAVAGSAIAALIGAGITYIGWQYLSDPLGGAPQFAGSTAPDPAHLLGNAKGVRDLATGALLGGLLLAGRRRLAGRFMAAAAIIPAGDALVVLANGGSTATALGVHGLTAVAAVAGGILLDRAPGRRELPEQS